VLLKPIVYEDPPEAPLPTSLGFPDLRREWRIAREALHLALATPALALAPRGDGQPVMLTPGWMAPQTSMEALRRFLRRKGYHATHWGLGTNRGAVADYLERLIPAVRARADAEGTPVALVGWSLGGVISREIAREVPDEVSCVVTFGSPVVGGPVYTATANRWSDERRGPAPDPATHSPARSRPQHPCADRHHLQPHRRHRRLARVHRPLQP
jgi:pimeloyl-ACP methyl ester carboxylesterase